LLAKKLRNSAGACHGFSPGAESGFTPKAPEAMISICVTLGQMVTGSPRDIWQSHGSNLDVSFDEFED
jgi:hypothetical protein